MTTNLFIILDKSGSMTSVREATLSGLNEYLEGLRGDGGKYNVNLTLFDTTVDHRIKNVALVNVKSLTLEDYRPMGGTALYDAVCSTLNNVEDSSKTKKNLVLIMTDGQENSSREYKKTDMQKIVKRLQDKGNWTFVFMGANQDAYAEAADYGIAAGNVASYNSTAAGTGVAFRAMSASTMDYASMDAMSLDGQERGFYSAKQKKDIEETK